MGLRRTWNNINWHDDIIIDNGEPVRETFFQGDYRDEDEILDDLISALEALKDNTIQTDPSKKIGFMAFFLPWILHRFSTRCD